jgi:succinyl-diaminopimelate desuccinylase
MGTTRIPSAELATQLAGHTLELVDIASESGAERDIVEHVLGVLRAGDVAVHDAGDTCVIAGARARRERPFVLLAGHLDTVPAQQNWPGRLGGGYVEGVGASDMKGGVAVMLALALAGAAKELGDVQADVGYLLFGREELPSAQSALAPLLAREDGLRSADLAVMLEPTANVVQAGCLGNLDATWAFHGRAGHSARPWLADNAIDRAVAGIARLHAIEPERRTIDGLDFTQVVTATTLHAGVARNVIPATAEANVNFRYSPELSAADAEQALREWCEPYGQVDVLSNSPGALPPRANELSSRLTTATGAPAQPKQAWTPVAEFAAARIEAVNFGPGDPAFAHRTDERVSMAALARAHEILRSFLCA